MSDKAMIYAELENYHAGEETVLFCPSPTNEFFEVVFEDDKHTGYFYGIDRSKKDNHVLEGLHIFNTSNIVDASKASIIQIVWSADGLKALLLINNFPHAAFDFWGQRAYCRTGFPPNSRWSKDGVDWDDNVLRFF